MSYLVSMGALPVDTGTVFAPKNSNIPSVYDTQTSPAALCTKKGPGFVWAPAGMGPGGVCVPPPVPRPTVEATPPITVTIPEHETVTAVPVGPTVPASSSFKPLLVVGGITVALVLVLYLKKKGSRVAA